MRADRNVAFDQVADDLQLEAGTFQLDHLRTSLEQLQRGLQRCLRAGVGTERQIGHQQRPLQHPGNAGGVVSHVGHADRQGRIMPWTTMPSESPTRIRSTPLASRVRAKPAS